MSYSSLLSNISHADAIIWPFLHTSISSILLLFVLSFAFGIFRYKMYRKLCEMDSKIHLIIDSRQSVDFTHALVFTRYSADLSLLLVPNFLRKIVPSAIKWFMIADKKLSRPS